MAAGVFRRAMNYGRDGPLNHEKQHIPSHPGHLMSLAENLASLSLSRWRVSQERREAAVLAGSRDY